MNMRMPARRAQTIVDDVIATFPVTNPQNTPNS